MSQISGTEPTAADQANAAPQPAPASEPAAAGTLLREDQVAVDRTALAAFGGSSHEAIRRANQVAEFEKAVGLPIDMAMQAILADAEPTTPAPDGSDPAAPPVEAPPAETPAAMTEESMTALLNKRDEANAEQFATEQDARDRASAEARVAQDKGGHVVDALKVIGVVPNEAGEWPKRATKDQRLFMGCLEEVMQADIPAYAVNDEEARDQLMNRTSPTPAQVARAEEDFRSYYADLGVKAVADFATGQSEVPGATVGAGAGGGTPPKKLEDMSHMDKIRALTDPRDLAD